MIEPNPAAIVRSVADVRLLKQEIRGLIKEGDTTLSKSFVSYREIGLRLIKLKESVEHGQFLPALDELDINRKTAWMYMKLAQAPAKCLTFRHLAQSLRELKEKESTGGVKGKKSKVRQKFAWKDFEKEFGPVARLPERVVSRYESEKESADYKKAVELLEEFAALMKAWRERLDK